MFTKFTTLLTQLAWPTRPTSFFPRLVLVGVSTPPSPQTLWTNLLHGPEPLLGGLSSSSGACWLMAEYVVAIAVGAMMAARP